MRWKPWVTGPPSLAPAEAIGGLGALLAGVAQDLPYRIGQKVVPELPARAARWTIVEMNGNLRRRCCLGSKRARRHLGIHIRESTPAGWALGIGRAIREVDDGHIGRLSLMLPGRKRLSNSLIRSTTSAQ